MDHMVCTEATQGGNVPSLQEQVDEGPQILDRVVCGCFTLSPLHIAASRGHTDSVKEIISRNPELAEVVDSCQRSPLHLASARGHVNVVLVLTEIDSDLCLARDRDGRNPLHLAVMKGKVDVLEELVRACPHAAYAVMDQGETILHLCMRRHQLECLEVLVDNIKDKEFVNAKDGRGDTILHLAVASKQDEVVKYLLGKSRVDVNATNGSGYTALDIIQNDLLTNKNKKPIPKDEQTLLKNIRDKLHKAGARRGKDLTKDQWLAKKRESLMIVATLIATIAFQAGVSPPGGVWQDNSNEHVAGEAVMASTHPILYPFFLRSSTIGLVASLSTILLLISGLPFNRRSFVWILVVTMWLTITSMAATFVFSIFVITPKTYTNKLSHTIKFAVIVWGSVMAILLLVHIVNLIGKAIEGEWRRHLVTKRLQANEEDPSRHLVTKRLRRNSVNHANV